MKRMKIAVMLISLMGVFAGCVSLVGENMKLPDNAVLLDVRRNDEFNAGHIAGAVLMPHDTIAENICEAVPDKDAPIFVYCRSGRRSAMAIEAMKKLGYSNLTDLGGMEEAKKRLRR